MFSFFPSLLVLQQLGPFFIRIALGLTFLYFGYKILKEQNQVSTTGSKIYGGIEVVLGISLIIGLYTQLSALIITLFLVIKLIYKIKSKSFLSDGVNYYILLFAMSLSLLVMGAGFLAFDMPL